MSKNYKFIINPSPPDSEKIDRYRDFDALLKKHEEGKTPVRKLRVWYLSGAVAASVLVVLSIFWMVQSQQPLPYEKEAMAYFASQPFVNPPMSEIKVPVSETTVESAKGDTLVFNSGSKVIIPAAAFVDQNGRPVDGQVNIQFKEMHDFVDFFLSGIPMHYDSNGVRYQLESAGMIEIRGFKNGQMVKLAPEKSIAVELPSRVKMPRVNTAPPRYNIYRLDVENRRWEYTGPDNIELIAEENPSDRTFFDQLKANYQAVVRQIESNTQKSLRALEAAYPLPEKPIAPVESNSSAPTFSLDFLDDIEEVEFYEGGKDRLEAIQNAYNGVIFQLAPNSSPVNFNTFGNIIWKKARITAINDQEFELSLFHDEQSLVIRTVPVLSSTDFQKARAEYEKKLAAYEQALQERAVLIRDQKDSLIRVRNNLFAEEKLKFDATVKDMVAEGRIDPDQMGTFQIINRFSIDQFGIWNCDRPIPPDADTRIVQLIDPNGKKIKGKTAFVASKKHNTVFQYLATDDTPIDYLDESELLIWVISEENQLALLKTLGPLESSDKEEMKLQVLSSEIKSEEALREILFF